MTGAVLSPLSGMLREDESLGELLSAPVVAVPEASRAFVLSALRLFASPRVLLVAVPTTSDAEHLAHDLVAFCGEDHVEYLPAWETLPFERVSPGIETMGRRLRALHRIRTASTDDEGGLIVVAPIRALLQRLAGKASAIHPLVVRAGQQLDVGAFAAELSARGYRREYQVEHRGEFAVRGGIVDIYPSTEDWGVRIDCFGDEVDRLTRFDLSDQRSVEVIDDVEIFGCRELLVTPDVADRAKALLGEVSFARDRFDRIAHGESFDGVESFLPWLVDEQLVTDLFDEADRIVVIDPRRTRDRGQELLDEEDALATTLAETWIDKGAASSAAFPRLHADYSRLFEKISTTVSSWPAIAEGPDTPHVRAMAWPQVLGDGAELARRVGELVEQGCSIVVTAEGRGSADRLASVLRTEGCIVDWQPDEDDVDPDRIRRPGVHVVLAMVDRGFICPGAHVAVLSESDATGRRRPHRVPRARARPVDGFFDDLAPGSFVVHHVHGVARYEGMVTRTIGGAERDYLLLCYRGDDRLYIPSDQIDALTPYSGGEQPSLSRLGGGDWQRQHARVRRAVQEVAEELVVLYQRRLASPGFAFAPDTPWQMEMESSFPYPETRDQLRAIGEVKADMERELPMDRLVCGDVGFGKTEVALRAVFKAAQDGKQAVVLVPTTLLASQHFQTFAERFAPFPIRIELLSRFLTPAAAKKVVNGLRDGTVDVVVGTHRLLGEDVSFSNLGLVVVDEEQRFGVTHKEALKRFSVGVDVLTLSANPIPRTLEMALTGIRDLSIIDTPPAARQPILTYVGELDDQAVAEAIRRELLREGQVFFVHNRVRDIEEVARQLRELVPAARIAVAHGQMDEGTLEEIVYAFSEHHYDVLVCTTIIESGIDMPTVNTLVVDRSDQLGLGQLHQLRGRVGRAGNRAYAYLFHPRDRVLSETAYERLRTIGEHTELGSGFKIAMRDLEIRGAGNLLGNDQSGHIAAVGYDLYVKMVAEAVAELKGEPVQQPAEIKLDLPIEAHLPASYVAREDLRLEAYRRLAQVRDTQAVDDIRAEWIDRFGALPGPAEALLSVARLRARCVAAGVKEVSVVKHPLGSGSRSGSMTARISPIALRASQEVRLSRLVPDAVFKADISQLIVPIGKSGDLVATLLSLLEGFVPEEAVSAG